MPENIDKEISLIYEKRRYDALYSLEKRKALIYGKIPEIESLDYSIKTSGIALGRAVMAENKQDAAKLKRKLDELKERKSVLLKQNSIDESELSLKYFCDKCKDTGFIKTGANSVKCSCYRTLVIENLYKNFTLDSNKKMTFEKFNINLYPDRIDKAKYGEDISPREKMLKNYNICYDFTENFYDPAIKNILIYGAAGVGKTFMCGCIANALINKGVPVLYISSADMFNIITAYRMGKIDDTNEKYEIYDFINTELLIIDDLGTESLTESRLSEFLEILNKKKERNETRPCHILITTNLTPREIFKRYSERIGSRITSEYIWCKFIGDDIRNLDI